MNGKHLSIADLERVRGGAASAEETEAVGRHVAECGECAALADQTFAVAGSVAAFQAAFDVEDVPEREPRPLRPLVLWAGAAAAAIAAVVFLVPRPRESGPAVLRARPQLVQPRASVPAPTPPIAVARPAEWDALVAETRRSGALPFPAEIRELAAGDSFRGPDEGVARDQVWPAATAIAEDRPDLRWPAREGDRSVVTVTSGGKEIARSEPLAASHWRVPVPLERGRMFRWQVNVERGEESSVIPAPPAPPAIFRVITAREQEALVRARSEAGDDHLLLGLLYARAGLVAEARRELNAHERATRDPLVHGLLRQLP
jgi:hypothetical protein